MAKKNKNSTKKPNASSNDQSKGYGHPPVSSRFPSGKSGHPAGRRKGRRNTANMTKDVLNRPVRLRVGDEILEMRAVEAILRVLANKASQGHSRSTGLINKLRDMAGLGVDVTEEERQQRTFVWPRPLTTEEHDLVNAPGREKDRQRFLAATERVHPSPNADDVSLPVTVPSDIRAGDELAARGQVHRALAAYWSQLDRCKAELTADSTNEEAQYNFRRSIMRAGLLADTLLLTGNFVQAIEIASSALEKADSEFWTAPQWDYGTNARWIGSVRAHANMLTGAVVEAHRHYMHFDSAKNILATSFEAAILRDFFELRALGYRHPLMWEVEKQYGHRGWVRGISFEVPEQAKKDFKHRSAIESADAHAKSGKLDEAADAYRSILAVDDAEVAHDEQNILVQAERNLVADRIGHMSRRYLVASNFAEVVNCVDQALSYDPYSTFLNLNRAHALMYSGRGEEAREIYLGYHGIKIGREIGQGVIGREFNFLQREVRDHSLMKSIKSQFASTPWDEKLIEGEWSVLAKRNVESATLVNLAEQINSRPTGGPREQDGTSATAENSLPEIRSAGNAESNPEPMSESMFVLMNSDDMETGEIHLSHGRLDDALNVFRTNLKSADAQLEGDPNNTEAQERRHRAVAGISDLAFRFILQQKRGSALECSEEAIKSEPELPRHKLNSAHAHMLLGHLTQAKLIYYNHREDMLEDGTPWKNRLFQEFTEMRKAGVKYPLMDRIEREFGLR